jgi:transcriptional regulator GlxA family with amidase domain
MMIARLLLLALVFSASVAQAASDSGILKAPKDRKILVAVVMTEGATMIDFAGPWEVFQDVHVDERGKTMDEQMPFELFTVGVSKQPIRTSGGMAVVPERTFADAPVPDIIVIGAQRGAPEMYDWLRKMRGRTQLIMSVCTGAFKLAEAGFLDGKQATTHHDFYDDFARRYPKVKLARSKRFVQADAATFTAGGLSSGIDLALHVVELYFGREVAERTARYMEYQGDGWKE